MSAVETILGCSPRVRMAPVLLLLATFATISQSSSDRYTAERDPIKQSAVNNLALQSPNVTTVGKSGPMRTDSTGSGPGAKTRDLKDCKDDVIGCQNEPISFERSSSEGSVPLSKHNQSNDSAEKCSSTPCTNTSLSSVHKLLFTPENRLQVYTGGTRENVFNRPGAINRTNTDTFHVKTPNEHTAGFSDSILSHSQNLDKGEKDENAAADKNTIYMTNGKVGNTSELNTSSRDLQNNAGEAILGESKLAAPFQTNTTRKRENSLVNVGNVTAGAFNNCIEEADPNETNPKSCFRTGVNPVVRDYDETGRESTRRTFDNATDGNPHINPLNGWTATTEATIRLESTLINVPPTTNSAVLSGNGKGKKNELPTDIAAKKQVSGKAEKHRTKGARNGALLSALILSGLEMKPSAIKRSRLSVDNQSIRSRGGVLNEASSGGELPRKSGDKQENNTPDQQVSDEGVRLKGTNVQYTNSTPTTETGGRFETNSGLTLRPFGDRASEKAEKLSDDNLKQTEINLNFTGDNSKNLSAATEVGVIYGTGTDRATSSRPQQNGTSDIPGDDLDPFRSYGVVKYANGTKASGSLADLKTALDGKFSTPLVSLTTESDSDVIDSYTDLIAATVVTVIDDNETVSSANASVKPMLPWPVKKEAVVEGDLVLGGLMMVHEREDTITCGPVMPQGGIQALEAMLYTLDRLNEPPNPLLPNITLGAHILDDCDKDTYGLEMAVDFIKGSISNIDDAEYHCNKTQVRKVISGVVGAASSVTSIQVANLLRLFKIPQVSFFSTSPELSNKQRFEFFTRTIPSDHYQVKAMVDIVRLMGWSYISIIYEESNYGIKAFEELEDLLADYNICIAVKEKLVKDSGVADESAYDNIVQKLLTKPRARGAIIFGSDQEVAGVMRAVRRSNATGSFSWIGSDGWSARSLVSDGNEAEVEGTLSVQPQANPVKGFKEYFLSLNVENNLRNPWFVEFWEHHFQCRYPNSSRTPYNQRYTKMCTGREKLSAQNTVFEDQLQFVSDAVMAFGYAIRNMHRDLCHGRPGLCDAMKPTKGTELLKYLRTVNFTGLSGDRFHFDQNGDGPARYNIIHFKQVSPGKYQWIRVGEYVEGELRLNMSEIQFKLGHPKPPESVCSLPCDLGQAKKYVEGESCCWHCFNCTQYQIRHPSDPTQCVPCPQGTVPDPLHVRCNDIPEVYLRPDSGWAIGAMAFSSTGILITMFVCGVFIRHNDTPVVRASGRELSYVLLAGILMCYCVTYALVLRPNDIVCGIQRFSAGFCFTVVYAALLTKTNRISRIFNAGKHSAKRPSFISPRSQLIICSGLIGVQILINGVWMVISPPRAIHHYPTREDNLLVCSSYIDASYMIAFTYPIFLIIICTVYAVLTRKIPEAFNESKHIGFTMYTTCVIWLAFVPLYFGTANHVALRITSMSVTISLSASVTVVCLFSPKLYIILIRPERNIRQSMMPMRYSAINKSSATTGSGSMMAAVMVTAATCNQKQQIQKHVPPIEAEEETDVSDKVKPQMKDSSTQTTPLSTSTNSIHNNSQEHLQKINNNCNVGNGPLALLPGVQIKDIPL